MSFSSDTKYEICQSKIKNKCCKDALLYGLILFAQTVSDDILKITTENVVAINLLNKLLNEVCSVNFTIDENLNSYYAYVEGDRLEKIYDKFFIRVNNAIDHSISAVITENTCCKFAFLKGAFLAAGYVSNPSSRYHFEISTPYYTVAKNLNKLLNDLNFNAKTVVRKSNYIVYMKESESIERFLCSIGANSAAFSFMDAKIYKEMRNYSNRVSNTKLHNIEKTLNKSVEQVKAIEIIEKNIGLDSLDDDLKQIAKLRVDNPDKSLNELVALSGNAFSRSGLNRKLKKLIEISQTNGEN